MPYSEWIENTGRMPEYLTKYAVLEAMYRDGDVVGGSMWSHETYWRIYQDECDIIKYRYVYEEDEVYGTKS